MKKSDSLKGTDGCGRSSRLFSESISSDETPETEQLLSPPFLPSIIVGSSARRQSLTAPPSPTDSRKKHTRHYMNHLHHLIHWRDIWGGEPHKANEVIQ